MFFAGVEGILVLFHEHIHPSIRQSTNPPFTPLFGMSILCVQMFAVLAQGLFQIQTVLGPSGFDVAQKKGPEVPWWTHRIVAFIRAHVFCEKTYFPVAI